MPTYNNTDFRPPAPFASVEFKNQLSGATVMDVPMLIDTGADVTIVPRWVIDRLGMGAESERGYEVAGFGDAVNILRAVEMEMLFCKKAFRGQYLAVEQPWGILGRNVLNFVVIDWMARN